MIHTPTFFLVIVDLLKDKTAWLGGSTSAIAVALTEPGKFLRPPETLEGAAALLLSIVTIGYIGIKAYIAVQKYRREAKLDI